ncbi:MAG: hypothetical protein U9N54_11165 [candidate division Zixibacteria bacterium]|nr:hypothetical protein [candidate division Zixibacteria bacterium]
MNKYHLNKTVSDTLVIHCADSRFQDAFRLFISKELQIENYIPLIIGGGIGPFALHGFSSINSKVLIDQLKLFITELEIKQVKPVKQVCLFNHQDCKWYANVMNCESDKIIKKQQSDLKNFTNFLKSNFKDVEVKSFWVILENEQILFEEL